MPIPHCLSPRSSKGLTSWMSQHELSCPWDCFRHFLGTRVAPAKTLRAYSSKSFGLREAVPFNGRRNFCVHRMILFKIWLKFEPFQIFKILLITLIVLVLGGGIG